jgi:hypothetical protein
MKRRMSLVLVMTLIAALCSQQQPVLGIPRPTRMGRWFITYPALR